jgi:hypothetical protein
VRSGVLKDANGSVQTRAFRPFQSARERVVYDSDTMEL